MYLILGSCRVWTEFENRLDAVRYPGGHVHSTSEAVQAFQIMRGEIQVPEKHLPHVRRGIKSLTKDMTLDLTKIKTVVLEISSIKTWRLGELCLQFGSGHEKLDKVVIESESADTIQGNLRSIRQECGD